MKKRIALLTYQDKFENYHDQFKNEYPDTEVIAIGSNFSYDVLKKKAKMVQALGYDAIVGRAYSINLIKNYVSIPLIPVEPDVLDVLESFIKYNPKPGEKFGILLQESNVLLKYDDLDKYLEKLFQVEVKIFSYTDMDDYFICVDDILNRGMIVGTGHNGIKRAKERGETPLPIFLGNNSFRTAIDEAIEIIEIRNKDLIQSQKLEDVLNTKTEGIITLNEDLNIQWISNYARDLFEIDQDLAVSELDVKELLPDLAFENLLKRNYDNIVYSGKKNIKYIITTKLIKDYDSKEIYIFVRPAENILEAEKKLRAETHKRGQYAKYTINDIFGESVEITECKKRMLQCAKHDANILIYGESGVGKEMFAQGIHNESKRHNKPFFAINCAALPENLLESELFGYSEGSFTGAKKGGKPGIFELAHTGTVFLDEIGELSMASQSALLRVLQEKEVRRIGDDSIIPIDVRVISASHRDIYKAVLEGKFRQDLFYRLGTVFLPIPPLREHKTDIMPLIEYYIKEYSSKNHIELKINFSHDAKKMLTNYDWRGNVRELQNFVQRLFAMGYQASLLNLEDVKVLLQNSPYEQTRVSVKTEEAISTHHMKITKKDIEDALQKTGGKKTEAAKLLGISRTQLWRLMNK